MNNSTQKPTWETFCDESYYGLYAVRPAGERRWGYAFHVQTKEEADGLCQQLSEMQAQIDNAALTLVDLNAENARLRAAIEELGTTAHCISKAGPLNTPTLNDAWSKFDRLSVMATHAIRPTPDFKV